MGAEVLEEFSYPGKTAFRLQFSFLSFLTLPGSCVNKLRKFVVFVKAGVCFSYSDGISADGQGCWVGETSGKCLEWIGQKHGASPYSQTACTLNIGFCCKSRGFEVRRRLVLAFQGYEMFDEFSLRRSYGPNVIYRNKGRTNIEGCLFMDRVFEGKFRPKTEEAAGG